MSLVRRNTNFRPTRTAFDRFLLPNDFFDFWDNDGGTTMPLVNISENENNYRVELAAPGLKKDDFNIDVKGNMITISAEKETETRDEKDKNHTRREYNYSSFSRSFTLPDNARADDIAAKYQDGILTLDIPKAEKKESERKIKVQ